MNLFDILTEALPLSLARKYRKKWDPMKYHELFSRYTDDPKAYRIYLPLIQPGSKATAVVKAPEHIQKAIEDAGFVIDDYLEGMASKGNQKIKIGKILQRVDPKLKNEFDSDPLRRGKNTATLEVVISRHPYDIAGMSTDRGWSSCMQLKTKDNDEAGMNKHYVMHDVKEGTIIAYLIDKKDRNIKKPKARILLKPFVEKKSKEVILVADNTYGTSSEAFRYTVNKWLSEVNKGKITGLYAIKPKIYQDGESSTYHINSNDKLTLDQIRHVLEDGNEATKELISHYLDNKKMWEMALEHGNENLRYCIGPGLKEYILNGILKFKKKYWLRSLPPVVEFSENEWKKIIATSGALPGANNIPLPILNWIFDKKPNLIKSMDLDGVDESFVLRVAKKYPDDIDWYSVESSFVRKYGLEILEANPTRDLANELLEVLTDRDIDLNDKRLERLLCTIVHLTPKTAIYDLCNHSTPDVVFRFAYAYHYDIVLKALNDYLFIDIPERYLKALLAKEPQKAAQVMLNTGLDYKNITDDIVADIIRILPDEFDEIIKTHIGWDIFNSINKKKKAIEFLRKYPDIHRYADDEAWKRLIKKAKTP